MLLLSNASLLLNAAFLTLILINGTQAFSRPSSSLALGTKHDINEEQNEHNKVFVNKSVLVRTQIPETTPTSTSTRPHPKFEQFRMRFLLPQDAEYVNSRWPYKSSKSLMKIRRQIMGASSNHHHLDTRSVGNGNGSSPNCCLGIEYYNTTSTTSTNQNQNDKNDDDNNNDLVDNPNDTSFLVACILQYPNGALGMLHVDEPYRRYGLGGWLLEEATTILEKHEMPCFAFIVDNNKASEALFTKYGWVKENPNEKKGTGRRRAKRKWIKKLK